jgi:low temperature requirement protein LtrA
MISRMGELVFLTLGECVLSLVLTQHERASDGQVEATPSERAAAFGFTFVLLSSLVILYHHANPMHRHHHASRRDTLRGLTWNYSHWPLVITLISVAACLKELVRLAAEPVPAYTVKVFGVCLATSLLVLALQELLHPGLAAYILSPTRRAERLFKLGVRALLGLALVAMRWLPARMPGWIYLGCACAVTCASSVLLSHGKASASERALWHFSDALLALRAQCPLQRPPARGVEVPSGGK